MSKLVRSVGILYLLLATSCAQNLYYGPEAGNWRGQVAPDSTSLAYTVYLLGDAGAPQINPPEPAVHLLKSQLDSDSNSTLVVLGDNLYNTGLAAEDAPAGPKTSAAWMANCT